MLDGGPPTPPSDLAGFVAADGLTLRWIPGTRRERPTRQRATLRQRRALPGLRPPQYETKLGPFTPGDNRVFTLVQLDAAGNRSAHSDGLRAVPPVVGKSLDQAVAALTAAGFQLGTVLEEPDSTVVPGTVVGPTGRAGSRLSTEVDLDVSRASAAPQTKLVFSVAASKKLTVKKRTTIAARIKVSRPATSPRCFAAGKQRLYTWQ